MAKGGNGGLGDEMKGVVMVLRVGGCWGCGGLSGVFLSIGSEGSRSGLQ